MVVALSPWLVAALVVAAVVAAVGALLLLRRRRGGPGVVAAVTALALLAGGGALGAVVLARAQSAASALLPGVDRPAGDRVTVALLGVDSRVGHDGEEVRLDAISVLSVSTRGGPATLFTLPRGAQQVPLPVDSPLRERWTGGVFDCGPACQLSQLYARPADAALYASVTPAGSTGALEAVRDGIRGALGIDVDAVVEIDAAALSQAVDVLGGVEVDVTERLPMASDVDAVPVTRWLEPGLQRLDGEQAAWFVRSRRDTSDTDRMRRQTDLLRALRAQVSPVTALWSAPALAEALAPALRTDLSPALAAVVAEGLGADLTVVPLQPEGDRPDWAAVHAEVQRALGG